MADTYTLVSVAELTELVTKNLEKHRLELDQARVDYANELNSRLKTLQDFYGKNINELTNRKVQARIRKLLRELLELVVPQDESKRYEQVLRRLSLERRSEIELTEGQFQEWVLDEANWRRIARASNTSYRIGGVAEEDSEE